MVSARDTAVGCRGDLRLLGVRSAAVVLSYRQPFRQCHAGMGLAGCVRRRRAIGAHRCLHSGPPGGEPIVSANLEWPPDSSHSAEPNAQRGMETHAARGRLHHLTALSFYIFSTYMTTFLRVFIQPSDQVLLSNVIPLTFAALIAPSSGASATELDDVRR